MGMDTVGVIGVVSGEMDMAIPGVLSTIGHRFSSIGSTMSIITTGHRGVGCTLTVIPISCRATFPAIVISTATRGNYQQWFITPNNGDTAKQ